MLSGCVDVNIMEYVMYSLWKLETDPSKQEDRTFWCIYSVSSLILFWTVSIQLCLVNSTGSMFSSKPETLRWDPMSCSHHFKGSLDHSDDFDLGSAWNELVVYPLCAVCWQWNRFRRRVGLRSLAQWVEKCQCATPSLLGEAEKFWGMAWKRHEQCTNNLLTIYILLYYTFDGWYLHLSFRLGDSSWVWGCRPGHRCLRKWRDLHDIDFEKFIGASLATEKGHWEGPRYWIREERMI